ncbi:helix-turn-helix domain-containing protein [Spirosoma panaciterrae]|uniref:helix-turn-helix domain-containing protein n=1 Tax=Spirosoma panaciterrae TaxID=496058 RepID=UPI00036C2A7E|nr:helix-turn-helix domain-containing protein [Spirosoma panaciterrae]
MKKQHVTLSEEHRNHLRQLLSKGSLPAKTFKRATALLELHEGKTFQAVAKTIDSTYNTVSAWASKYQTNQLAFLKDAPRSGRPMEISGQSRAKITALACSESPDGHSQWSLRLLANRVVELGYCEHLSHTQAGTILKKTSYSPI